MEAWEQSMLSACLTAGAKALEYVLLSIGGGRRSNPVMCACGHRMESVGLRSKDITTLLGVIRFPRSLYVCPACDATCFPADRLWDIVHTGFSPGVRRLMARAGAKTSFGEAQEDLRVYSHVHVEQRDIERVAEAVGLQIEAVRTH